MEDRRGSVRTGADWPVKIITPEKSMKGEVIIVSLTGAFIKCVEPLSAKDRCHLTMELPKGKTVNIDVEVVWSTPSGPHDESSPRGMGVRSLW